MNPQIVTAKFSLGQFTAIFIILLSDQSSFITSEKGFIRQFNAGDPIDGLIYFGATESLILSTQRGRVLRIDPKSLQQKHNGWTLSEIFPKTDTYKGTSVMFQLNEDIPQVVICAKSHTGTCAVINITQDPAPANQVWMGSKNSTINNMGSAATAVAFVLGFPFLKTNADDRNSQVYSAWEYDGRSFKNSPPFISMRQTQILKERNISYWEYVHVNETTPHLSSFVDYGPEYKGKVKMSFIYGFTADPHVYFLANTPSGAKLVRVLKADVELISYTEIPIRCGNGEMSQNEATTAVFASQSRKVSNVMEKTIRSDHSLYISFHSTHDYASIKSQKSQICIFPILAIQKQFDMSIEDCRNGNLSRAHRNAMILAAMNMAGQCGTKQPDSNDILSSYNVSDSFVVGNIQLDGYTMYELPNERITTLQVGVEPNNTSGRPDHIAFIGTASGKLGKISMETANSQFYLINLHSHVGNMPIASHSATFKEYFYFTAGDLLLQVPLDLDLSDPFEEAMHPLIVVFISTIPIFCLSIWVYGIYKAYRKNRLCFKGNKLLIRTQNENNNLPGQADLNLDLVTVHPEQPESRSEEEIELLDPTDSTDTTVTTVPTEPIDPVAGHVEQPHASIEEETNEPPTPIGILNYRNLPGGLIDDDRKRELKEKQILFDFKQLTVVEEIGEGHNGRVQRGFLTKQSGERVEVAIKSFIAHEVNPKVAAKALVDEAELMRDLDHENVLSLVGVTFNMHTPILLTQYMDLKDLHRHVREPTNKVTVKSVLQWCLQVAKGMRYLSTLNPLRIHRDLAARNCMLHTDGTVKIADFGLARILPKGYYRRLNKTLSLPVRWLSPEIFNDDPIDSKADVWSFGVLVWELFERGEKPYSKYSDEDVLLIFSYLERSPDNRLKKPDACPLEVYHMMRRCWKAKPEERPTFTELVDDIDNLLNNKLNAEVLSLEIPTKMELDPNTVTNPQSANHVTKVTEENSTAA